MPQKHFLELLGVVWRELVWLGQRIQGWRHWRSQLESVKWNFMAEVSLAQSWNSHLIGKGSLAIACVVPLLHSEFQGSGFLAAL